MPRNKKYKVIDKIEPPVVNEIVSPLDKVILHAPAVVMNAFLGVVAYNLYEAGNFLWITITVTILFIISREVLIYQLTNSANAYSSLIEQLIKMYHYWSDEALKSKAELIRKELKDEDRK